MTKIIKTTAEYTAALEEIERLIDLDPTGKTDDAERLELLTLLVEDYESKHFPKRSPEPIEAILFYMEQHGMTPRSLIPYIGSRSKVSEVLSRKRPLTLSMIRALHDGLGIPAAVLIQESAALAQVADPEDDLDWSLFPIKEMVARGWVEDSIASIKAFISLVHSPIQSGILLRKTKHIRSVRSMDTFALTAWVAQIIARSEKMSPLGPYKQGSVNPEFMKEVARLSVFDNGPLAARDFLAKHGLPLIIEPHLPSTYLDGAAILINKNRPVIAMTLRYDRLDNFWFTLMHELAHVALHWKESIEFIDDLDIEAKEDPKEREADLLAGEVLIPKAVWSTSPASKITSPGAALSLAKKLGVHPAIAAGKMRYERKAFRLLNNLIGHREVRKQFPGITWSD